MTNMSSSYLNGTRFYVGDVFWYLIYLSLLAFKAKRYSNSHLIKENLQTFQTYHFHLLTEISVKSSNLCWISVLWSMGIIVLETSLNLSLQILQTKLFMFANIIRIPIIVPRTEKKYFKNIQIIPKSFNISYLEQRVK